MKVFFSSVEIQNLIVNSPDCHKLAVSAWHSSGDETVTLHLGNWDLVILPCSLFETSGDGITPDFNDVEITDWGQTLRLGEYEASVEALINDVKIR